MAHPQKLSLDKTDPTPLYVQLYRQLRRSILDGEYKNGQAIPSEPELQEIFSTTRGTVRNAVALLVSDGLVRQIRGKGTFVELSPVSYSVWNFGGFSDYARSRHEVPISLVVEQEVITSSDDVTLRLVRARGVQRGRNSLYLNLDTSWLSLRRFPGLEEYDFGSESLYRVLREEYDTWPHHSEFTVSAIVPDDDIRRLLAIENSVACLTQVDGETMTAEDEVIERTRVIYSPAATLRVVTAINVYENEEA